MMPMHLTLVPHQLLLFPGTRAHSWSPSPQGIKVRENRSGKQWVESVIGYCEWRAGNPWRRLSDPAQRNDPERWDYLDASRLIHQKFYAPEQPAGLHFSLPVLNPAPSPLPQELELAELPRKTLVDALLRENSKLSDRKILMSFKRSKLARMLAQVRVHAKAQAEPERMRA